jgi:tryptophanase
MDYVIEAVIELFESRKAIRGLRIVESPATLRHFSARFEEIEP